MDGSGVAEHRTIVVVDVEGFGDPRRTLPHQRRVRDGMYRVVREAFGAARVPWDRCHWEDRGDSVFVLVPADIPKAPLVEVVPGALARALQEHNLTSPLPQQIRLRLAVHAGEVAFDENGVTSTSVLTAFRLLDAEPLKTALAASPGNLAVIVSEWIFDEVVRHSAVIDPATFQRVPVRVKETSLTAWIALPDHPNPADDAGLVAPSATMAPPPDAKATTDARDAQDPPRSPVEPQPAARDADSPTNQSCPTGTTTAHGHDNDHRGRIHQQVIANGQATVYAAAGGDVYHYQGLPPRRTPPVDPTADDSQAAR